MDNHTQAIKLAEKWATLWRNKEDVNHKWLHYNQNDIGGLTNFKVGPPTYLDGTARGKWKASLINAMRGCIREHVLPHQDKNLQKSWWELREYMIDTIHKNQQPQSLLDLNIHISQGINRVYKQSRNLYTDKTYGKQQERPYIPPPPVEIEADTHKINREDNVDERYIGTLRRGELYTPLNRQYHVQKEGGCTRDIASILGWAIYGCKHRENFVYRNIVKYMDRYRDTEEVGFPQMHRWLKNGRHTVITKYTRLRNLIQHKQVYLSSFELDIVALLYQTQIRLFKRAEDNNEHSNVTCLEQTTQTYDRVVNILKDDQGYWVLAATTENNTQKENTTVRIIIDTPEHTRKNTTESHPESAETHINNTTPEGKDKGIVLLDNTTPQNTTYVPDNTTPTHPHPREPHLKGTNETPHTLDTDTHSIQTVGDREEDSIQTVGDGEEDSISTTSSIAALFIDKQLEKQQARKGNTKHITRRLVWNRWRNLVRGKRKRKQRNKQRVERKEQKKQESKKLVFDYTTHTLSEGEISLLGKGETFCVVNYNIDEDRSKVDLHAYQRRLRLHECFRDPMQVEQVENRQSRTQRQSHTRTIDTNTPTRVNNRISHRRSSTMSTNTPNRTRRSVNSMHNTQSTQNTQTQIPIVTNTTENNYTKNRRLPSTYDPESINRNLNRYNTCIQEEIMLTLQNKTIPFRDNITPIERAALKTLTEKIEKKQIIITKADKGSGLVVVDYDTYIEKGTKYIEQEAQAYDEIEQDEQTIIAKIVKSRNNLVDRLTEHQIIPPHTALYIKKQLEEKITGIKFYYKIHKDTNIETMPLRPLQSCIKAPTHHLSIVLTDLLQPLLTTENIPTFIFDSNQLLFRLHHLGSIPEDCTLITSDVAALYPSIPHQEGFIAMHTFLKDSTKYSEPQITSILKALELVITENYTTWNTNIYKQVRGVAMGTPVAVAYANIFMHWVDKEIKVRAPYIHEHIRYIDDNIFILPTLRIEDLMHTANNILPPHIRFTYERLDTHANTGLPFLDTQLTIAQDYTIQSRLYTKKTDRHAYLLPTSYHPPHITHNIPTAVFGRIKKLCSREQWYREDAQTAVTWLLDRGYKKKDIDIAMRKVDTKDRWQMIEHIELNRANKIEEVQEGSFRIPLIMTYNQHNTNIKKILQLRQPLLNNAFNKTKVRPRISYRRQRNLNDTLIQKGLRGPIANIEPSTITHTHCGETPSYRTKCPCRGSHRQDRCRCCIHTKTQVDNIQPKLYKPVDCNSKNLVYIIGCKRCDKKYVGETQQRLKDRLAQHMYNMDKLNQPLHLHFRYTHKLDNLYITIAETVKSTEPFFRKVREAWWINHLHTLEPQGLNVKLDCNQIYTVDTREVREERRR